jgi:transposase
MAAADRSGLPVAVGIASGQHNEQKLVVATLNTRFLEELPEKLIGDTAYDSDPLHAELAGMGVEMIAPHHPRRKRKTQDLRKLRRYRRRWHIERLFAWMMRCRRLVNRYECKAENFLGFVQPGLHRHPNPKVTGCVLVDRPWSRHAHRVLTASRSPPVGLTWRDR